MKRIAFFAESKLVNTQKVRWGLSYFLKKKIQIKIFNIAPITRPEYFKKYLPPNRIEFPKEVILTNEKQAIESIRKKPTKGLTTVPLSIIHEGEMAIVVYHDENNDNKLNTGLFWRPKEGYAFSNQYVPKGPPKFTKAKINVSHNQPIEIQLNY